MTQYTTGELAKLCDITVRTVQFYDSKNLLNPSELSEGGRRIYSDGDLEKLHAICFLKDLGFSLKDIDALLNERESSSALKFLIENQQQKLTEQIERDQEALLRIKDLQNSIAHFNTMTPNIFGVIADIMESKKKLRNMRIVLTIVGLLMDLSWIAPLIYGILTGAWWPFAIGAIIAIVLGIIISRYYITHTAYVCPECHVVFRPPILKNLLAAHTPSMRKLTCPVCGYKGYCLEIYVPGSTPQHDGKYLVWSSSNEAGSHPAEDEDSKSYTNTEGVDPE